MARMTISMPATMSDTLASRVASGSYRNVSESFRDLMRREQHLREVAEELGRIFARAVASGGGKHKIPAVTHEVETTMRADGRP